MKVRIMRVFFVLLLWASAALADGDKIEAELAEMKAAMGSGGNAGQDKSE